MTTPIRTPRCGAAIASCQTRPGVRVFGVVSTDETAAGLVSLSTRVATWTSGPGCGEHLWMVGSAVQEQLWWAIAPQGPRGVMGLDPLPRSVMRLRIGTTDSAKGSTYEIDLGQSLELWAEAVHVELWAPEGSVEVTDRPVAPRNGLLFDSQCMVRMLRLEVTRGACSALLTESVLVPAGDVHVVRVPAGARRLTAYAELTAPIAPAWRWLRGDPATVALELGTVAWTPTQPRVDIDVPSATHLRIGIAPGPRLFTFVWTIAP